MFAKVLVAAAAAVASVPAMLFGAGIAHASTLNITPAQQVGGIWVGWDGGSGGTWCTYTSDWYTNRVYQNASGRAGLFIPAVPLNRPWDINVNCDNGDTGFLGGYVY